MSLSQVLAEGAKLPMSPLSIGLMVMIIFVFKPERRAASALPPSA